MPGHKVQKLRRPAGPQKHTRYILVMGLTGAGKSTFISTVTGNQNISIGTASDLLGVTQEVQDYILDYSHNGDLYEIHLIDSPGFDDGGPLSEADILQKIADYVNTGYKLKQKLAGVLYLHDITKEKIGRAGLDNIRLLEGMIGSEEYKNCTLVTTKWGRTKDPQGEEKREEILKTHEDIFAGILHSPRYATMERFDPRTKARALDIIKPLLESTFTLKITRQMADPHGPKLALGETDAGKVVDNWVKKSAQTQRDLANAQQAKEILAQKYDEMLFEEFNQKRKKLRRKANLQRSGRWIMRTTLVGGAIVATVLTLGPGASAFVLEPAFEKAVSGQKKAEKKAKEDLKAEFVKKSQRGSRLKETDPDWLDDTDVKELQDLDSYSLKSLDSNIDVWKIVKQGEVVGSATLEGSEALPDTAENTEWSDSDADSLESDFKDL